MSRRTIIEINHDYLVDLNGKLDDLVLLLRSGDSMVPPQVLRNLPGVTYLGERHHSEQLTVLIGGRKVEW